MQKLSGGRTIIKETQRASFLFYAFDLIPNQLLKWSTCSRGILRVCNDYYIAIRSLYCRRENGCLIERTMILVWVLTYRYIWESPWGNHLDPETTTTHSNIADSLISESWADPLIRSFQ